MNPAMQIILADLKRHRHLFNLDSEGLGKDLCKAATDGVQRTIDAEQSPEGISWARLSEDYEDWKSKRYPGQPIAVLHKIMAQPDQVAGEVEVSHEIARVTYGISGQARQEATWFQEGSGRQPPRRFWGFTEASLGEIRLILDSRFRTA